MPTKFARNEKVELAAVDGSFGTELTLADGSLILADAKTAMGSVEPLTRFGPSAFGPIRLRVLAANGAAGDWLPLGTLVRIPSFKELRCPRAVAKPCTLAGSNLFLADSIAATPDFESPVEVPQDFAGTQLTVPHPSMSGVLYLKLRDDPATVQTLALPITLVTSAELKAAQTQGPVPAQPTAETPASSSNGANEANEPATPPAAADTNSPAHGTGSPAQPNQPAPKP